MKKSILLALALPLILGSCTPTSTTQNGDGNGTESSSQTTGGTTTGGNSQTGGQTSGGTEGSGTGTTTGGGTSTTTSESVLKDVSDFGLSNSEKPSSIKFDENITLTCNIAENRNKNAPAYYTSDESLRFYFGNTLTVSNSKGVISRIVLYYNGTNDDNLFSENVGSMADYQTWVGSSSSVTFKVEGSSGQIKLYRLQVEYSTSGGGSTTGGGTETGGGGGTTTGGGGSEQSGNGNTSSEWTTAWTGVQYDIAYSLFKGNLPCLKAFNGYYVGCREGTTIMYFNPYVKGWSKDSQTYYDNALRDMGYTKIDEDIDEEGDTWVNYKKGTYYVRTSHYRSSIDGNYYFDVYAYNEYQAPFKLDYTPTVDLTTKVYPIKSGYKAFSKTINGITFACNNCTENSGLIQLAKQSMMEITSSTALSKLDILFNYNMASCLVYAGSSSSNAKIVYNNGNHWDLPSGTKYVKLLAVSTEDNVQIDCLSIK